MGYEVFIIVATADLKRGAAHKGAVDGASNSRSCRTEDSMCEMRIDRSGFVTIMLLLGVNSNPGDFIAAFDALDVR